MSEEQVRVGDRVMHIFQGQEATVIATHLGEAWDTSGVLRGTSDRCK